MPKAFFILIFFSLLVGCSPAILFEEPQPPDTKALTEFPEKLHGDYQSLSNSSILHVSKNAVVRVYDFNFKEHINDLDSNFKLIEDTLIDLEIGDKMIVHVIGDTIYQGFHSVDTLFLISQNNVLKKYKGHYFLSTSFDKMTWEVKKLSLNKNKLVISRISAKEDLELLKEITETPADTTSYNFKPTQKQFKKFMKQDGFNDTEEFTKLK